MTTINKTSVSVWGISDLHIDYEENLQALLNLDASTYASDALIIAGDASDKLDRLEVMLSAMTKKFRWVGFVPGNHELWVKRLYRGETEQQFSDSLVKFEAIRALCKRLGVFTTPQKVGFGGNQLWLVPLFSWYHGPDESEASLYSDKHAKKDLTADIWSDFFLTQWPRWPQWPNCPNSGETSIAGPADYFFDLNKPQLSREYDAPILTFSHFLPLKSLINSTAAERAASSLQYKDLHPEFNFSMVAGSSVIDQQLRQINSKMHLYGHQHRNRYRQIDGVTYVAHCMGYPKERKMGLIDAVCVRPKLLWDSDIGFV